MMRKLTADEVQWSIEAVFDDTSIQGNCSAIDDATDKATESWILHQVENHGNVWAWCVVTVTASWNGFHGSDTIGECSYESLDEFTKAGGYYEDMKACALDDLNAAIAATAKRLAFLED